MILATSRLIKEIDACAQAQFNIPTQALMERAGKAIAESALSLTDEDGEILVLCGNGNNGGDGYAAASMLASERRVTASALFDGSKSEASEHFFTECKRGGVEIIQGNDPTLPSRISKADLIIDAIFGTGFHGELSEQLRAIADAINSSDAVVLAVDVPLGISADTGEVDPHSVKADATVALTLYKPAHFSYPAKGYMGAVRLSDIGLTPYIAGFESGFFAADEQLAVKSLPKRAVAGNKGSFGKTVHITGSDKYRGAAHLAVEASLRAGIGMVYHFGSDELNYELRLKYPEAIYVSADELRLRLDMPPEDGDSLAFSDTSASPEPNKSCPDNEYDRLVTDNGNPLSDPVAEVVGRYVSLLVGSGSTVTPEILRLIKKIISSSGSPIIIDADGINSIAKYSTPEIFKNARRTVVLTPHPLEFSRLCGVSVEEISARRLAIAMDFAKKYGVILLLKGAGTIVTDGERAYVNTSGSTALSKGGSGDVLAGLCASLVANCDNTLEAVALAAYLHGRAGDTLSAELSDFGVTPSDLPKEIARHIKLICDLKQIEFG